MGVSLFSSRNCFDSLQRSLLITKALCVVVGFGLLGFDLVIPRRRQRDQAVKISSSGYQQRRAAKRLRRNNTESRLGEARCEILLPRPFLRHHESTEQYCVADLLEFGQQTDGMNEIGHGEGDFLTGCVYWGDQANR